MPAARDCRQFHTVACVVGDPVPPTPLDDVYNRDALAGRACPQPLPSSLDVRRGGDGTCPPYSDAMSVVPPPIPPSSSSDRVCGRRLLARPNISAVPGFAEIAVQFSTESSLKAHVYTCDSCPVGRAAGRGEGRGVWTAISCSSSKQQHSNSRSAGQTAARPWVR